MLDLNEVAMFVEVVAAGSFAEAARRLGMPANTLSRHIRQLEEHLGTRLLQRSTRKLALTEAGSALHRRSATQVADVIEATRQLVEDAGVPSGTVKVAAPADFFDFFRMAWVSEFLAENPRVRLDFELDDSRVDLITEGIDVAFRGGKLSGSNLVHRQLGAGRLVFAASPEYLASRGTPRNIQELSGHDFVVDSRRRAAWHIDGPTGAVTVDVNGRFAANTVQAQLRASIAGLGICLLPETLLTPHIRAGALSAVLPDHGKSAGGFYVIYAARRESSRAVAAFIDVVLRRMRELEPLKLDL